MYNQSIQNPLPASAPTKKSFLLPLLAVLLLLSTLFLAYQNIQLKKQIAALQYTPTPTPSPAEASVKEGTANWKTYINTFYGYSIKHAQNYEERESTSTEPATSQTEIFRIFHPDVGSIYITEPKNLGFGRTPKNYSDVKNFVESFFNIKNGFIEPEYIDYDTFSHIRYKISKFDQILVDRKPGIRFIAHVVENQGASSELNLDMAFIELPSGKILAIYGELGNQTLRVNIVDQILSTFQFLDQNAVTPSCTPRPACLDSTPRCMIPETEDMCPRS